MLTLLAGFAGLLLYPIWLTIAAGFSSVDPATGIATPTLYYVRTVFTDAALVQGLINAFGIAVCTTILSTVIALPLALVVVRYDFPGKSLVSALVLVPLILPPFVGAIGLGHLLGRAGTLNTLLLEWGVIDEALDILGTGGFWAVVLVEALHLYPIIYLNATAALANLDPALEEAAECAGASRWRRLRSIVLPLIRPGLFAGGTIVFIWSFTELGTPLMFDYQQVTPVQIFSGIKEMADSRQPYALTAVMLLAAVSCYVLGKLVFGGRAHAMYAKASVQSRARPLGFLGSIGALGLFGLVTAIAILPHVGVVLASLAPAGSWYGTVVPPAFTTEHFEAALGHPLAMQSIRNSLVFAAAAVGLDIVVGLLIGYLVVRTKLFGRQLLDALAMLPLAVPGLVLAFGYVAMSLRWPFAGSPPPWLADLLPASWWDAIGGRSPTPSRC